MAECFLGGLGGGPDIKSGSVVVEDKDVSVYLGGCPKALFLIGYNNIVYGQGSVIVAQSSAFTYTANVGATDTGFTAQSIAGYTDIHSYGLRYVAIM